MEPLSPNGPLKVAVSIDDPFMWKGADFPPGYSAESVMCAMGDALAARKINGVYSFVSTAAVDGQPELLKSLDKWSERGHYVGAHTHTHLSLNWCDSASYIADVDYNIELLQPWLDEARTNYFRYAFDMWGDSLEKTNDVQSHLARRGFTPAPISTWFYDVQFLFPYIRAVVSQDQEGIAWLQGTFVETAIAALRNQASAARSVFGRDPVHISLVHGTPIAGDAWGDVLDAYIAHGVEFVSMEEAMNDPANQIVPPTVTRFFRNSTQKWCEHAGVEIHDTPPQILKQVGAICPIAGMEEDVLLRSALQFAADGVGATLDITDLDWGPR